MHSAIKSLDLFKKGATMLHNIFRLCMLLISWSTLLLYPKRAFKRFLPVTIFVTALVSILLVLSHPYKLWKVSGGIGTRIFNDLSFTLGPFFVTNLWVFRLAYGNLWQYLGINLVIDYLLAFPITKLFKKISIYQLERLKSLHFFSIIYSFAIFAYGFQYFFQQYKR
ncbi:hypothetical protein [Bacillus sp. ISL-37]|uniref:hypothetical protein n=1 Tax=Bacillus sp. ISL-37 TaxID=2819123 RepID=UPI001BE6F3A7|nr:hypothetical protein [Bacillus sp. ISL-37]MBT2685565.1 hypothetical protein [Bacillus sp. ISL-37]